MSNQNGNNAQNLAIVPYTGGQPGPETFSLRSLKVLLEDGVRRARTQIDKLRNSDEVSIAEMFEMQMLMNNLSQLSELSTGVASAAHNATMSMARNVKG